MQLYPDIEAIETCLWLKSTKTLIISDLHLGYEAYLNQKGVLIPKFQLAEIQKQLNRLINKLSPQQIIINGDLRHDFASFKPLDWLPIREFLKHLLTLCHKVIIIKGNHDTSFAALNGIENLEIRNQLHLKDILVAHGDKIIKTAAKIIIIGHEHPAITLREKSKYEKFKCFLYGEWKNKQLIALPSFNPLVEGTDILKSELLSPYLKNISALNVLIVGEEENYLFGKVKKLKEKQEQKK